MLMFPFSNYKLQSLARVRLFSRTTLQAILPLLLLTSPYLAAQQQVGTSFPVQNIQFSHTVTPSQFGAVGNCITDDTAAFIAMRDSLLKLQANDKSNTLGFIIESPAGKCYRYSNNRWTWGLKRLKLEFNGSSVQNIGTSKWKADNDTFSSNRAPFSNMAIGAPYYSTPNTYGALIRTASKGDTSVTLHEPSDAAAFRPGSFALVYAYDQEFGGFPPNPRYYDYVKVVAVNRTTVVLDRALTGEYREDYPELASNKNLCGRARILNIDREDIPFAEYFEANGIKALPNPALHKQDYLEKPGMHTLHNQDYFLVANTYTVVIRDCDLIAFIPTMVHDATIIHTKIAITEADKIIDNLRYVDCTIDRTSGAYGVKNLEINGGKIDGIVFFNPRQLSIKGTVLNGATQTQGGYAAIGANIYTTPTRTITVEGSTLNGKGAASDRYVAAVQELKLTVDGSTIRTNGNTVIAPLADRQTQRFLGCIEEGARVSVSSPDSANHYSVIKSIRGDGRNALITLSSDQASQTKDTLTCLPLGAITFTGNKYPNWNLTAAQSDSAKPALPKGVIANFEHNSRADGPSVQK